VVGGSDFDEQFNQIARDADDVDFSVDDVHSALTLIAGLSNHKVKSVLKCTV